MAGHIVELSAEFIGRWTQGDLGTLDGFEDRFPGVPRLDCAARLLADDSIDLVLTATIPADRATLAIAAIEVDKPGCNLLDQLNEIKTCVARTGRIG